MKSPRFLPFFLAFSIAVSPLIASAATPSSTGGTRYYVPTTKSFWRNAMGPRHIFSDGFTADLSDFQIRLLKFAGLKPIVVKKYSILATTPTPTLTASPSPTPAPQPITSLGWGVKFMLGSTHPKTDGGLGVTVAVLDTGIDTNHPDLHDRIGGCINFANPSSGLIEDSCSDGNGHGTHSAGIIAADGGPDGIGMFGFAPQAKLLAYRVCDDAGVCYSDDIAVAIQKAVDAHAQIITLGFGGEQDSSFISDALQYAADHHVLVIAAAGNDGPYDNSVDVPARDTRVIAVGALASDGTVADFSSRGNNESTKPYHPDAGDIEFIAPGVNIESTFTGGGYAILSGTSMAAPHVAGLAALLWQGKADNPAQVTRALLRQHSEDVGPDGDDNASGWGVPLY